MYHNKHVTVIIPALNEAEAIGLVIDEIPVFVDDIIVVDNGSTDGTGNVARDHGARVVRETKKGYGAACLAGIAAIDKTDLVAFIDGDYSDYPAELAKIIAPVALGEIDLAMGCRQLVSGVLDDKAADCRTPTAASGAGTGLAWHQRAGNWLVCCFIRLAYGYRFSDLGPMRCIRWDVLDDINMMDEDYGWTIEMQIKASNREYRIIEIPVNYRPRVGESKISGTIKGSVMAGYKIIYWSVRLLIRSKPSLNKP